MGLGGMIAGAAAAKAADIAARKAELNNLLKGRTDEQKAAIRYLYGEAGCLKKGLTDEEYDAMVMAKAKAIDFKQKALDKIGLDESQVNEVAPIHFEAYWFDEKTIDVPGKDGLWRSSAYMITWVFFSSTQVYAYQYTFNMANDTKNEKTEEYFYKDITNFSTTTETAEKLVPIKKNCKGEAVLGRTNVESNRFMISAMGDKFYCATKNNDYTEKAIQGMKAKLREKKEQ
ncbi:MAG: hypothetical protein LBC86_02350 [Oscillospiraceae bacterium]|jgi:hypothetical protein|nr:hypothetical protein [Oscillospiraceae bacterium]